ncbi:hypothetical protein D3C85_1376280 [compost metagenome]
MLQTEVQPQLQELTHELWRIHELAPLDLLQDNLTRRSEDLFRRSRANRASGILYEERAGGVIVGVERDGILHCWISSAGRDCPAILGYAAAERSSGPPAPGRSGAGTAGVAQHLTARTACHNRQKRKTALSPLALTSCRTPRTRLYWSDICIHRGD